MKNFRVRIALIVSVVFGLALLQAQQNPNTQLNRRSYFVVFFTKGSAWNTPQAKEEADRTRLGHLTYLRKHVESGDYVLTGPLLDEGPIRGIIVLGTSSAEEALRIVNDDPMVRAKQFAAEIHPAMFPDLSTVKAIYPNRPGN